MPGFSVYGAIKAAIRNFARHCILDLKQRLIRVNAISPGPTMTPGLQLLASTEWSPEGSRSWRVVKVPPLSGSVPAKVGRHTAIKLGGKPVAYRGGCE